jgi:hypothetical protein
MSACFTPAPSQGAIPPAPPAPTAAPAANAVSTQAKYEAWLTEAHDFDTADRARKWPDAVLAKIVCLGLDEARAEAGRAAAPYGHTCAAVMLAEVQLLAEEFGYEATLEKVASRLVPDVLDDKHVEDMRAIHRRMHPLTADSEDASPYLAS